MTILSVVTEHTDRTSLCQEEFNLTRHLTRRFGKFEPDGRGLVSMAIWQLQDAKARFSELVNAALKRGPQVISRRGIPTAVLVPIEEWRRLQENSHPSLKELLLRKEPRFEDIVPARGKLRLRVAPEFE